jgi:glycosidase
MNSFSTFLGVTCAALLAACASPTSPPGQADISSAAWLETGVCYEIFVRSFKDSDGDGIGDLDGLIEKLDYVNDGDPATTADLGANCVWLMPVAESPSYHGYDVTDYYTINPDYGTNDDFRRFTTEAHRRGIKVLVDMVINHMSDQHPIFQEALNNPNSQYRGWFRFSPAPGPDNEWGDNNWRKSPVRDEYYYGFFSHRMPDLNWEAEPVREEMKKIASYWLGDMGADGLRLDAVWHLMEGSDGQAGHVPRTHEMLREYGDHVRSAHPGSYTLGEVFDGSEAIFAYYPDQLDAFFAFGVSGGILDAVQTGNGTSMLDAVIRMQNQVPNERWAPFLRNHDQTRTLTYLGGDLEGAKLAATFLLTLPGLPFVYYGEELGMTGDKPDPRLRTPMHWNLGHASGFTTGTPWELLQDDWQTANVEVLDGSEDSILDLYRELIRMRLENPTLGASAELVPLRSNTPSAVAYLRRAEGDAALVVANLGMEPLAEVDLWSEDGALAAGDYTPRVLLGDGEAAPLSVGATDRLEGYVPLTTLEPRRAYVFLLSGPD